MSVDSTKIEIGEGTLELKITGDTPAETAWTDVGACQGAELMAKKEITDVECGQKLAPIIAFITGEEATFKVTMLEHTIRNIVTALGLRPKMDVSSTATYEQVIFGGQTLNVYMQFRYRVAQQADSSKVFEFISEKARAIDGITTGFTKKEERRFEVTFKCYPDTNDYLIYMRRYI